MIAIAINRRRDSPLFGLGRKMDTRTVLVSSGRIHGGDTGGEVVADR